MSQAAYEKTINVDTNEAPANSASMDMGGEILDDTKFTNVAGYRSRFYGLRDWSMSLTLEHSPSDPAFTALKSAWLNREGVDVEYLPDGTAGFSGVGVVESFNYSGAVADKETVEVTIQGNGQLTEV